MNLQELKGFLKRNNMTGGELAAKLGVHWTTISRWLNGHDFSVTLCPYCERLHVFRHLITLCMHCTVISEFQEGTISAITTHYTK